MVTLKDIQKLRKSLGFTQKELASRAGISQSMIAKIEAGVLDPSYTKAKKIIDTLDSLSNERVKASDILNKRMISVSPEDDLKKTITKMKHYNISQLPVIDDKKIVGMISESIIVDALMNSVQTCSKVKCIMKDSPPTITKNASLNVITQLLKEYPMILVYEKGKLLGHITKSDIITKAF